MQQKQQPKYEQAHFDKYLGMLEDKSQKEAIERHVQKSIKEWNTSRDHSFNQHAVRRLIDHSISLYSSGKLKSDPITKEPHAPTARARLLFTLNPETFKAQNVNGEMDHLLVDSYAEAVKEHKRDAKALRESRQYQ